jgi:hypothetical protein
MINALILTALTASPGFQAESPATWAFVHPKDPFTSNALLDLRSMNEKQAGESGFVKLSPDGNSFVLGNGKPVRFWAVGSDGFRLSPDEMAEHARFLAKLGVNMVRMHTQICSDVPGAPIDAVNQKEIDGIWRFVAALKKEGIYSTISPYWANDKQAENWGLEGYGKDGLWGLLFFNEKLQTAYKGWVKQLYTRTNPYTGIPLAKDPEVAILQVQNEDGMLFWTMQALKAPQQVLLGKKFGVWLVKKYGSLTAAKTAWQEASNDKDDFPNGVVGLSNVYPMTQNLSGGYEKRVDDECEFYVETQRSFYAEMEDYYHNTLGCRQLVNACNWITADPIKLNDLERWTYTATDVLAVNKYTGGVHLGENDGWRIDPGHFYTAQSCLLDPRALPTNLKQAVGHPMLITESTWVSPELYQSEGPFLAATYESLTGVDALYWFAAGDTPEYNPDPYFNFVNIGGQHAMTKWTCSTPMLMGSFPANALMYRLGYLKEGSPVVSEHRPVDSLWSRETPIIAEDRTFDPNRDTGITREKSNLTKGVDPLAFLVGPVQIAYSGSEADDKTIDLVRYINHQAQTVDSATGQVRLNYGKGICTVNSPKAQGVCGFLKSSPTTELADVTIRSENPYATILAASMDNLPLETSHKILVQVTTTARPTGWQDTPTDFKSQDGKQSFHGFKILKTGSMPWQVANSDVQISVRNPTLSKATLLDTSGYPATALPTERLQGALRVSLPGNAMYVILE